jgi:hypothetical protein
MRKIAFFAPLAAALAVAAASPTLAQTPTVNVSVGGDLQQDADKIGTRDVNDQATRLARVVQTELERRGALDGARVDLVLTELKPNRPTMQQMVDRPGLDGFRSISIGGATIEGQVTLADGQVQPVRYDWYSNNLQDVRGASTWQDAETAYQRLATNLVRGRYVSR